MNRILLSVAILTGGPTAFAQSTALAEAFPIYKGPDNHAPVEKGAVLGAGVNQKQVDFLVNLTHLNGLKCARVSSTAPNWSKDFDLKCDGHKYRYSINNHGDQWFVKPAD
jgi:hypothetical protein